MCFVPTLYLVLNSWHFLVGFNSVYTISLLAFRYLFSFFHCAHFPSVLVPMPLISSVCMFCPVMFKITVLHVYLVTGTRTVLRLRTEGTSYELFSTKSWAEKKVWYLGLTVQLDAINSSPKYINISRSITHGLCKSEFLLLFYLMAWNKYSFIFRGQRVTFLGVNSHTQLQSQWK
jgi:hypothetical protein